MNYLQALEAEQYNYVKLKQALRAFFAILDSVELSDSGKEFHPVTFHGCRVEHTRELEKILEAMRRFSGLEKVR